jgi:hypothetical protein
MENYAIKSVEDLWTALRAKLSQSRSGEKVLVCKKIRQMCLLGDKTDVLMHNGKGYKISFKKRGGGVWEARADLP